MHLPKRDVIATGLVAVAAVLYLLWATGSTLPGMSGARATGIAVLALGFAASAAAVVPGFDQLLHGSKTYLAVTSLIGLAALAAGVHMLITANGVSLTLVMAAMAVLWLIATIHHSLLAKTGLVPPQPVRHGPRHPRATPA
jgi:predicted branched-subunit amino acid permease